MPRPVWTIILLFRLSHVAEITGTRHHTQPFIGWDGVLRTFLPRLAMNCDPPDLFLQVARLTGASHCAWLSLRSNNALIGKYSDYLVILHFFLEVSTVAIWVWKLPKAFVYNYIQVCVSRQIDNILLVFCCYQKCHFIEHFIHGLLCSFRNIPWRSSFLLTSQVDPLHSF
jgi:hypothetical protein